LEPRRLRRSRGQSKLGEDRPGSLGTRRAGVSMHKTKKAVAGSPQVDRKSSGGSRPGRAAPRRCPPHPRVGRGWAVVTLPTPSRKAVPRSEGRPCTDSRARHTARRVNRQVESPGESRARFPCRCHGITNLSRESIPAYFQFLDDPESQAVLETRPRVPCGDHAPWELRNPDCPGYPRSFGKSGAASLVEGVPRARAGDASPGSL